MPGVIAWLLAAPPPCPPWLNGATRLQIIVMCAVAVAALTGGVLAYIRLAAELLNDRPPEPERYRPPKRLRKRGLFKQL